LRLVNFRLDDGRRRGNLRLATIFCERFAREKNRLFRDTAGRGGSGSFGWAMVEAPLRGTARFEAARLTAAIFRAALVAAAVLVTTRFVTARFAALRRSIFGRREIATAYVRALPLPLRAPTAMASSPTPPSPAATSVTATITTTVAAAAVVLAAAIAATGGARRVILCGVVMGRKILGSGGVRIGLALFAGVMNIVVTFIVNFGDVSVGDFAFSNGLFDDSGMLLVGEGIVVQGFVFG
jgi:hypothetical protein